MGKVTVKCDNCNKEFQKYSSKIGKNNFCCRECYLQFHSKNVPICKCIVCGTEFKGNKYNSNKFCSRECYEKEHSIKNKIRICPTCNKNFIAKSSEDKYCSRQCYDLDRHMPKKEKHWNWKGGISVENDNRDSAEYKQWRLAVYERDNYTCKQCGSKIKINAHHIKSWKDYPNLRYDVKNGITLCEKCHINYHKIYGYKNSKTKKV